MKKNFKSNWNKVKFDDIAENLAVRVMPSDAETEYYVGLEHLDSESLKIRRWGTPDDVGGQKLRFWPGDIIFGKRRCYQRKLAVAEFEGICSAHAMVLRAKEDTVVKEFLPFFLQSDMFMQRALDISVGSLSPTINWKTLKVQEFPLPPKDEQRRIAEILWAADNTIEKFNITLDNLRESKRRLSTELTTVGISEGKTKKTRLGRIAEHWEVKTVGDIVNLCQYGLSIQLNTTGQYPIFRMMNFEDGRIIDNDMKYVDLSEGDFKKFKLEEDDILFNRTNSAELVGKVGIYKLCGDFVFASYLVRLRVDKNQVLPDYLNYYLNTNLGQRRLLAYATHGVSQTNINASNLKKVLVPLPPMKEQEKAVQIISELDDRKTSLIRHIETLKNTKMILLKDFLG